MSQFVLDKYRSLRPINDEKMTHAVLDVLVKTPQDRLANFYGASVLAGRFYMVRSDEFPGNVLEYVPDHVQDTSVTTLCEEHPIYESRQSLIDAREEIITAIDRKLLAMPGTTTVLDEGRGKEFRLAELGTAQLLDVLQHFMNH